MRNGAPKKEQKMTQMNIVKMSEREAKNAQAKQPGKLVVHTFNMMQCIWF